MPAIPQHRSRKRYNPTSPSSSSTTAGPSNSTTTTTTAASSIKSKPKPLDQRDGSGIPGISKLKAQIRQTKRLLAKDSLEPGLKVSTQRRLVSLEADLAKAEKRDVEKKNGGKYHMVKFFERQKLMRIIKKIKRKLSASDGEPIKPSKKEKLERDLHHARVMLNYILHYPNEQKYISLFPPSSSSSSTNPSSESNIHEDEPTEKTKLPPHLLPPHSDADGLTDKSEKKRLEILKRVEGMMNSHEISKEPEEEGRGEKRGEVELSQQLGSEKGGKGKAKEKVEEKGIEDEDDFFE